MNCKICNQKTKNYARSRLRYKYDIQYFICDSCQFIQTEEPYWLDEAYANPIASNWVGMVLHNQLSFYKTQTLILSQFNHKAKFVDFGGGYGLLVRMMRDAGFDFYRYDLHCSNLFANGFDIDKVPEKKDFELATAFEVFEHFVDPITEIQKILLFSDNILFSTLLIPENFPKPEEWNYFDLENGQHISLYSYKSLAFIANYFGLYLSSDNESTHILSKKKINPISFKIMQRYRTSMILRWVLRKSLRVKSLLEKDYQVISQQSADFQKTDNLS